MKLGIMAGTFPGIDPSAVLQQVREAGYTAAQFSMTCAGLSEMPDEIPGDTAETIAEAARRHNVEIAAISATYNMIHPDPAVRRQGLSRLRTLSAACGAIGTRVISLCTGTRDPDNQWRRHPDNDTPQAWQDLRENMAAAARIAEEFDVDLGIEPEFANVVSSAEKARRIIDEIGSPRLRVILDAANLFEVEPIDRQRAIIRDGIHLLADRIVLAHAKDRAPDGRFTTAGQGVLDYVYFFACLKEIGYDGPLITHTLTAAAAPAVATFLSHALAASNIHTER